MKKSLFSFCRITVLSCQKSRALSVILASSLTYKSVKITPEGKFQIEIFSKDKISYKEAFDSAKIAYDICDIDGYLSGVFGIKGRIGILLGVIFTACALYLSSNVVWRISVTGNTRVSDKEVIAELDAAGFHLGTFIPTVDYDTLHNKVLLNSARLSWISVNVIGNVANVHVREKNQGDTNTQPTYTNVIASSDGYIEKITVKNGKKEVMIGQVVRQGEILISGIIDSSSQGVRYEQADGEILAYVNKEITVKIPYKTTEKVYTGNRYVNKSYKIYNFLIKFSSKYGNQGVFYDKIEHREYASVFGIEGIPLEAIKVTLYEYELKEVVLTKEEAVDKGFSDLRLLMDEALKGAELISKKVTTSYDDDGFYISCQLYCLENIAKKQEFYVNK